MANIKQSIVVQRQIPEHIRNSYPLFVEFVKSYYQFLDQSQTRSLEEVRDIDVSLDEFIDKFKSELAKNVPVELSSDKRKLIKHLKEFYLSRGSEASYKFLFNTLFGKNAELFYPSAQILRVSDGKWKQDVSIFVELNTGTQSLQEVNGKFIKINTNRKTIETFVENVVQYDLNTFEIFIQREYSNEIVVGAVITYEENGIVYTGTVVQCPSKLKIFKAGRGFKAGDIFALKTQLGRGCIVKVTKTNSDGGIFSIQVIRFGLDYKTKFYSYLSSKDYKAFEYVHPLKLHPLPNPNPAYNERSGGFIDYGFSSKQTYMFYDEEIPVGTVDRKADRYFVDGSYVGDIQSQFYADDTTEVIDEDLAIIEIELGAVAKYPGYYLNADGFISDEMYIHDGDYYQAFSYVIKVEEELRAYADIVRALVHPSGMKLFAEYSIYKELKLEFTQTLIRSALQLPFDDAPPSKVNVFDAGFNYNNYVLENGTYVPAPGASIVFSEQGNAALFLLKQITDVSPDVIDSLVKSVTKNIRLLNQPQLSKQAKEISKPIPDDILASFGNRKLEITKAHQETQEALSSNRKTYEKNVKSNDILTSDLIAVFKEIFANLLSSINTTDDDKITFTKNVLEDISASFGNRKLEITKAHQETQEALSSNRKTYEKNVKSNDILTSDLIAVIIDAIISLLSSINTTDDDKITFTKNVLEDISASFGNRKLEITKALNNSINTSMNGRIKLSSESYDSEEYYQVFQDFQTLTTLS